MYITYGFGHFDKEKFSIRPEDEIKNLINKPRGAWWGSPENAKYGWKEWCEDENFGELGKGTENVDYIKWKLKDNAKVFRVERYSDLLKLPVEYYCAEYDIYKEFPEYKIDFNELRKMGYDGLEVCMDHYYFGHIGYIKEEAAEELLKHIETKNPEEIEEIFRDICQIENTFYTWDCDSICVWNADAIEIIEEKSHSEPNYDNRYLGDEI